MADSATPTEATPAAPPLKNYTIEASTSGILAALAATIPDAALRVAVAGVSPFLGAVAGMWIRHMIARYNYKHRGRWLREDVERINRELSRHDLTDSQRTALLEQLAKQNAKLADLEPPQLTIT